VCADCPSRLAEDLDAAIPTFLEHHQDLVYGVAMRLTRHPADAEDLAQEAFVRAYRALAGYAPDRLRELRPRGWLAAIVANLGRNRARRKRPPTDGLDVAAAVTADPALGPEGSALRREDSDAWQARLEALPSPYRRAVELRHVVGLSYPELAVALRRPVGTVKSDVHRGVRLLRERYQSEEAGGAGRGLG
jgi:RNA polymerase sigma-70 factor (ECF subfamily)